MRDWTKLRVFTMADALVIQTYRSAGSWPPDERYSLTQQIKRASVSAASNIVEGCSRESKREYMRFIEIAYGSACELQYQLSVARRMGFAHDVEDLEARAGLLGRMLNSMLRAIPDSRPPIPGERSEP